MMSDGAGFDVRRCGFCPLEVACGWGVSGAVIWGGLCKFRQTTQHRSQSEQSRRTSIVVSLFELWIMDREQRENDRVTVR